MIMFLFVIWSGHLSQLLNLARMSSNGSSPEAQALYSVREAFVWSVSGVFCGLVLLLAKVLRCLFPLICSVCFLLTPDTCQIICCHRTPV